MRYFVNSIPNSFFAACEQTSISIWINHSLYAFAIIETVHIIGLAVLLGTMLVIDIRLLGGGDKWESPQRLAKELAPWIGVSMVVMICTGIPMFLSEATRLSRNVPFYYKLIFLLLAFTSHFTIHRKASGAQWNEDVWFGKVAACLSVACWFGVALAGRAIGFL